MPRRSPHLEEVGARPRRDVTAPGTSCGSLGGARGPQGAWPERPDHSREISPQPGPNSSSHPPVDSTSVLSAARSASKGVCAGGGLAVRDPAGASAASGSDPGWGGVRTVRTRGRRSHPPAGAAAEAGCEERPSAPRADGGASSPCLSRCTEGAAGPRSPRQRRSMGKHHRAGPRAPLQRVGSFAGQRGSNP